jgi:hypothetical protein
LFRLGTISSATSPEFGAAAKVLKELITHHVQEEERNIWADARDKFSAEERVLLNQKYLAAKTRAGSPEKKRVAAPKKPVVTAEPKAAAAAAPEKAAAPARPKQPVSPAKASPAAAGKTAAKGRKRATASPST